MLVSLQSPCQFSERESLFSEKALHFKWSKTLSKSLGRAFRQSRASNVTRVSELEPRRAFTPWRDKNGSSSSRLQEQRISQFANKCRFLVRFTWTKTTAKFSLISSL